MVNNNLGCVSHGSEGKAKSPLRPTAVSFNEMVRCENVDEPHIVKN